MASSSFRGTSYSLAAVLNASPSEDPAWARTLPPVVPKSTAPAIPAPPSLKKLRRSIFGDGAAPHPSHIVFPLRKVLHQPAHYRPRTAGLEGCRDTIPDVSRPSSGACTGFGLLKGGSMCDHLLGVQRDERREKDLDVGRWTKVV